MSDTAGHTIPSRLDALWGPGPRGRRASFGRRLFPGAATEALARAELRVPMLRIGFYAGAFPVGRHEALGP